MTWDTELEYDFSGLPLSETLRGSAVAYFVWPSGGVEYEIMDFMIDDDGNRSDTDLRGRRRQLQEKGRTVPPLSRSSMKGISLAVLMGPETGPKKAIRALRKMADLIEKRGLVTGASKDGFEKEYLKVRKARQS